MKVTPISKKFHRVFRFTRRTAEVTIHNGAQYSFVRHVLETGPAVSVLPYFFDKKNKQWHVVMVRQYRPAVDAVCLEAPGGLLKSGKDVRQEMARELYEEAGFKVNPKNIALHGSQHLANSFCDQVVHLGSVKLPVASKKDFMKHLKIHNGLMSEREFTEVAVLPLSRVFRSLTLVTYTLARYQIFELGHRIGALGNKKGPSVLA